MCPKRTTFGHFWAMVWEMGSTHVINLTHDADKVGSGAYDKRERYWPPFEPAIASEAASRWIARPELLGAESLPTVPGLSRYTIRLTHNESGEQRVVHVLWYSRWIDFADSHMIGTEAFYRNAGNVLALAYVMREVPLDAWPVVHCSAGVGRTGTFVVLCVLAAARARLPPPAAAAPASARAALVRTAIPAHAFLR
jgi:protein tyrosine phosphatase